MELINATRMVAGYTMGLEPSGRELLVVVIKGTFVLPKPGEPRAPADEQLPLVMADTFTGEPGFSAPVYEIDFAPRKHALRRAAGRQRACARRAGRSTRLRVGLRVGPMKKAFDVVGDRVWQAGLTRHQRIGTAALHDDADLVRPRLRRRRPAAARTRANTTPIMPNPVGRGWHKHLKNAWVDGTPLPNTEEIGKAVSSPSDKYKPMAFGPIGRGWPPRARFAGTYDQQWLDRSVPVPAQGFRRALLPGRARGPAGARAQGADGGGAERLHAPMACGSSCCRTSRRRCTCFRSGASARIYVATLDTIAFEPDLERFTMTGAWRGR